jgi:Domain of unknown function (DUF4326)
MMKMPKKRATRLVNLHYVDFCKTKHTRIDRKSVWGNPYILKDTKNLEERMEALWNYTLYLLRTPILLNNIPRLEGKTLACWCTPTPCHGEILIQIVNNPDIIVRAGKACADKEALAAEIFNQIGWEQPKKKHVQLTLF